MVVWNAFASDYEVPISCTVTNIYSQIITGRIWKGSSKGSGAMETNNRAVRNKRVESMVYRRGIKNRVISKNKVEKLRTKKVVG